MIAPAYSYIDAVRGITDCYDQYELAEAVLRALATAYVKPEWNSETIERVLAELINSIDHACDYFPDSDETEAWQELAIAAKVLNSPD